MANCFSPPVGNRGVRVSGQSLSHRIVLFDGKRKAGERGGKKEGQSLRGHETIARVRHDSDANDLLALCASFLLLFFLPSFLPPSILLLRTHAHVTLPRYSRNQFTAPVIFAAIAEIRDLDPFVARASQLIVRPSNPITFPITSNIRKNVERNKRVQNVDIELPIQN